APTGKAGARVRGIRSRGGPTGEGGHRQGLGPRLWGGGRCRLDDDGEQETREDEGQSSDLLANQADEVDHGSASLWAMRTLAVGGDIPPTCGKPGEDRT